MAETTATMDMCCTRGKALPNGEAKGISICSENIALPVALIQQLLPRPTNKWKESATKHLTKKFDLTAAFC